MNYARILAAALSATIAYFTVGFALFTLPVMKREFAKYHAVYRPEVEIKRVFPIGMAATFAGIVALTVLYARSYDSAAGFTGGVLLGTSVAIFAVCGFVIHNHVNLNIGWRLTIQQAIAYFIEWLLVGVVIGLIYKPSVAHWR